MKTIKYIIPVIILIILVTTSFRKCKECTMVECENTSDENVTYLGEKCGQELKDIEDNPVYQGSDCEIRFYCE